jgi:hypothetical protein
MFNAIQIGTVMTQKEFRGQGLGVILTSRVLEKYGLESDFFYLFAHNKVWDYYQNQGFVPVNQFVYSLNIETPPSSCEPLRKLDLSDPKDFETIVRLSKKRNPVSKTLGILDDTSVFLFYCLNAYRNHLFYSDAMDCLLVFTGGKDRVVHVFDVLCPFEVGLADILSWIGPENSGAERVIFHFKPDYADLTVEPEVLGSSEKMFFKGDVSIQSLLFD